ncbi:MAG: hypothetical protein DMG89_13840 [Acidobacteria bacterium]|nr:MAG: hypothetical protein DMG89_13840 [Acidobacteriota bacterium]
MVVDLRASVAQVGAVRAGLPVAELQPGVCSAAGLEGIRPEACLQVVFQQVVGQPEVFLGAERLRAVEPRAVCQQAGLPVAVLLAEWMQGQEVFHLEVHLERPIREKTTVHRRGSRHSREKLSRGLPDIPTVNDCLSGSANADCQFA